jgi:hypothetical protein
MFELGFVDGYEHRLHNNKSFKLFITEEFKRLGLDKTDYSILYNCTNSKVYRKLTNLGFKKIGSYRGQSKVTILLWKPNCYTWLEKLKILFS